MQSDVNQWSFTKLPEHEQGAKSMLDLLKRVKLTEQWEQWSKFDQWKKDFVENFITNSFLFNESKSHLKERLDMCLNKGNPKKAWSKLIEYIKKDPELQSIQKSILNAADNVSRQMSFSLPLLPDRDITLWIEACLTATLCQYWGDIGPLLLDSIHRWAFKIEFNLEQSWGWPLKESDTHYSVHAVLRNTIDIIQANSLNPSKPFMDIYLNVKIRDEDETPQMTLSFGQIPEVFRRLSEDHYTSNAFFHGFQHKNDDLALFMGELSSCKSTFEIKMNVLDWYLQEKIFDNFNPILPFILEHFPEFSADSSETNLKSYMNTLTITNSERAQNHEEYSDIEEYRYILWQ